MIELIAYDTAGEPYSLDIDQEEVVNVTRRFLDITDIEERLSGFSRSFSLPATPTNDLFFGSFGDPTTVSNLFTTQILTRGVFLEDGVVVFEGSLELVSHSRNSNSYTVNLLGEMVTVKKLLGEAKMSDLRMADWIHSVSDITDTWDRSLFNGDLVYGMHDFGDGYGLVAERGDTLKEIDIHDPLTPIQLWTFVPSFRLNELLRRMFESHPVELSGDIFTWDEGEEIYAQADTQAFEQQTIVANHLAEIKGIWWIPNAGDGGPLTVPYTSFIDNEDIFDNDTNRFVITVEGDYTFVIIGEAALNNSNHPINNDVMTWTIKNEVNATLFTWNTTGYEALFERFTVHLNVGQTLRAEIITDHAGFWTPVLREQDNNGFLLELVENVVGVDINPAQFWGDITQIEFLKSVMQTFNLVLYFKDEDNVHLVLEFYNTYMERGVILDWSDNLDLDSEVRAESMNPLLRDPINLSYKDGDDTLNKQTRTSEGRNWGAHLEPTGIPFAEPKAENNPFFCPAPTQEILALTPNVNDPSIVICKYYESVNDLTYRPPGFQLMYYNGMRNLQPGGDFYTQEIFGGGTDIHNQYPFFSNYRLYFAFAYRTAADTLDLNYAYWPSISDTGGVITEENLYTRCFSWMLRERYADGQRVMEFKCRLTSSEIAQFNFYDKVLINIGGGTALLRPIELTNITPGRTSLVTVRAILSLDGQDAVFNAQLRSIL